MHLEGRDDSRQRQGLPLREVHRVGPTSRSSCPYRDGARTDLDSLTTAPSTANSSGETPAHYVITTPLLAAHLHIRTTLPSARSIFVALVYSMFSFPRCRTTQLLYRYDMSLHPYLLKQSIVRRWVGQT